eukprot:TRINITY_DN9724_c0_g1_i1.p1 TRINITY_DN9724_c0_g1~~TRINITY_DN9724_c0_g1_i1.p1  ORF type:complete len:1485 (+),score=158.93 TRINITY_DN9724_c0_g1_i1:56-4456(+)
MEAVNEPEPSALEEMEIFQPFEDFFPLTIRYESVKNLGSRLNGESLYEKISKEGVGAVCTSSLELGPAEYWFVVHHPNIQLVISTIPEKNFITRHFEDLFSYHRIKFPRKRANHELLWTFDGKIIRITNVSVILPKSKNDKPKRRVTITARGAVDDSSINYARNDRVAPSNTNTVPPNSQKSCANIILVPTDTIYQIVSNLLQRLKYEPKENQQRLPLWVKSDANLVRVVLLMNYDSDPIDYVHDANEILLVVQRHEDFEQQGNIGTLTAITFFGQPEVKLSRKNIVANYLTYVECGELSPRAWPVVTQLSELQNLNLKALLGGVLIRNDAPAEEISIYIESWIRAPRAHTNERKVFDFEYAGDKAPAELAHDTSGVIAGERMPHQILAYGYNSVHIFISTIPAFSWLLRLNYASLRKSLLQRGAKLVSISPAQPKDVARLLTLKKNECFCDGLLDLLVELTKSSETRKVQNASTSDLPKRKSPISNSSELTYDVANEISQYLRNAQDEVNFSITCRASYKSLQKKKADFNELMRQKPQLKQYITKRERERGRPFSYNVKLRMQQTNTWQKDFNRLKRFWSVELEDFNGDLDYDPLELPEQKYETEDENIRALLDCIWDDDSDQAEVIIKANFQEDLSSLLAESVGETRIIYEFAEWSVLHYVVRNGAIRTLQMLRNTVGGDKLNETLRAPINHSLLYLAIRTESEQCLDELLDIVKDDKETAQLLVRYPSVMHGEGLKYHMKVLQLATRLELDVSRGDVLSNAHYALFYDQAEMLRTILQYYNISSPDEISQFLLEAATQFSLDPYREDLEECTLTAIRTARTFGVRIWPLVSRILDFNQTEFTLHEEAFTPLYKKYNNSLDESHLAEDLKNAFRLSENIVSQSRTGAFSDEELEEMQQAETLPLNEHGATPLHVASFKGDVQAVEKMSETEIAKYIDFRDMYGNAPIDVAVNENIEIIKRLKRAIEVKKVYMSPIGLPKEILKPIYNNLDIVSLLRLIETSNVFKAELDEYNELWCLAIEREYNVIYASLLAILQPKEYPTWFKPRISPYKCAVLLTNLEKKRKFEFEDCKKRTTVLFVVVQRLFKYFDVFFKNLNYHRQSEFMNYVVLNLSEKKNRPPIVIPDASIKNLIEKRTSIKIPARFILISLKIDINYINNTPGIDPTIKREVDYLDYGISRALLDANANKFIAEDTWKVIALRTAAVLTESKWGSYANAKSMWLELIDMLDACPKQKFVSDPVFQGLQVQVWRSAYLNLLYAAPIGERSQIRDYKSKPYFTKEYWVTNRDAKHGNYPPVTAEDYKITKRACQMASDRNITDLQIRDAVQQKYFAIAHFHNDHIIIKTRGVPKEKNYEVIDVRFFFGSTRNDSSIIYLIDKIISEALYGTYNEAKERYEELKHRFFSSFVVTWKDGDPDFLTWQRNADILFYYMTLTAPNMHDRELCIKERKEVALLMPTLFQNKTLF